MSFYSLELHTEWEDKENVVEFDFLGKDSVRYWNFVPVEKKVGEILRFLITCPSNTHAPSTVRFLQLL